MTKAWLLVLLLAGTSGACDAAPLVDKLELLPPEDPPVEPCTEHGTSPPCSEPDTLVNSLLTPRALVASSCSDPDPSLVEPAQCSMPAPGAAWRSKDIRIATVEPLEVVLSDMDIADIRAHLVGPVTLRFEDVPNLRRLAISSDSAESYLIFDHVAVAAAVTLGDETTPFAGHVEVRHTRFESLSMNVASVELDSVAIVKSFVAARRLDSGDGAFDDVVMDVGDALFAPSALSNVRIIGCNTLSFFGSTLRNSIVPRCEGEPTRLYDVDAKGIVLDGDVHGESGLITKSQLGRYEPSEYVFWGMSVTNTIFCDQTGALKSTSHIRCSYCTERAFGDDAPCNLEEPANFKNNPCDALELRNECEAPLPERFRRPAKN